MLLEIKKQGGNGFVAENRIYGEMIHLLKCPICKKDNYEKASYGKCGHCGFDTKPVEQRIIN